MVFIKLDLKKHEQYIFLSGDIFNRVLRIMIRIVLPILANIQHLPMDLHTVVTG